MTTQSEPSDDRMREMMNALSEHVARLAMACPVQPMLDAAVLARMPVHETVWGEGGVDVLIIHGGVQGGLGGGPDTFDGQRTLAEDGWKIRLVDRPGFGKSPSRGPDDMLADAVWIADRLMDDTHLIGHSWGGAEALLAAARAPERVRSLILIEPALELLASTDPAFAADPQVRALNTKRFAGWMNSQTPAEYGQVFSESLGVPDTNPADSTPEEREQAAMRLGCAFLSARMAPIPAFQDAVSAVAAAQIPVLVVSGGWSRSFDLGGEIVARMLNGRHAIVAAPNHFVHQETPAEFNALASAFMKAAPARR